MLSRATTPPGFRRSDLPYRTCPIGLALIKLARSTQNRHVRRHNPAVFASLFSGFVRSAPAQGFGALRISRKNAGFSLRKCSNRLALRDVASRVEPSETSGKLAESDWSGAQIAVCIHQGIGDPGS
jgi:hypothetical protein